MTTNVSLDGNQMDYEHIYSECLNKFNTIKVELRKIVDGLLLLDEEIMKEKLGNAKLNLSLTELNDTSGTLENLLKEMDSYDDEVKSYIQKLKADEFFFQRELGQEDKKIGEDPSTEDM